ncbi:recombinase family protein [Vallitalea guaymasensis]|uniref:recombinase family protein n=1 Tax=Vallitalea guaymasensis TaxID=1185412 RepID=UPI00272D7A85|nr:recombinase family protein [Vallitalea guaymasensis]
MSAEYCIYLRKSRSDMEAEAHGEGETLARHEKILLDLSKNRNLDVTKIYKEIVSGETISSRPVIQQVLSEVEQGIWSGVLVVEVERLARGDTIDQGIVAQSFKFSNTKIITPMKDYDPKNEFDEEYFEFGLFMSRREYKTINRRLQRGRIESVKEGKYLGNKPPYGYKRKKLENDKGYTLEIYHEQAKAVKLIFNLYTKGELHSDGTSDKFGLTLIANKLNELKIPPVKSKIWVESSIRDILKNPVYIGKIRWNSRPTVKKIVDGKIVKSRPRTKKDDWILVNGLHEPIIDNTTFELAQKRLSENSKAPIPSKYNIKNPLAGIAICGMCGRKMVRRSYTNSTPDYLICKISSCNNISCELSVVEEKLIECLRTWLINYKLDVKSFKHDKSNSNLQHEITEKSIKKLDEELMTLIKQSNTLHDLLEQGVYSVDKFLERSKIITDKISQVKITKNELLDVLNQNTVHNKNQVTLIPKIERILEIYGNLTNPAEKNELLKEVIDKVIYTKTVNGRWHGKPDDFNLVIYPKLPKK